MDLGIRDRHAIVCASSKGIGKACALSLAQEGVHVTLNARNREPLEAAAADIRAATGVRVATVLGDIGAESTRAALFAACPAPDILVNNNGGPPPGRFRDWDRDAWIAACDANMLTPLLLIRVVIDGMIERRFGRIVNITSALASDAGRARVRAAIASQAEHFDMLGLQLGFTYESGAIVPDATAKPAVVNPVREFVPNCRPGARLAHGLIERAGAKISTLDLIPPHRFVLLGGPNGEAWVEQARAASLPLDVVRWGVDVIDPHGWWHEISGAATSGAILVRPDQHVAARGELASDGTLAAWWRVVTDCSTQG